MQWPGQPVQNGAQAQTWPGQPVVAPSPAPRPQAPRQVAPNRQPAALVAPIPISPALNDLGITDAEERAALIAQGYSPSEVDQYVGSPEMADAYVDPVAPQPDPIVGPRTQQPRGLVPASGYAANPALFDPSQPYNPARTVSPGETVSRALTDEEKANPELLRQQGYVLTGPGVWSYAPSPEQMVAMGYRPEGDAWVLNEGEDYIAARNDARSRMNAEDTGLPERIRAVTNGMSLGLGDELEQLLVEADTRGENLNRRIFGEEIPYTSQVAGTAYDDEADARQNRFRANRPMQNLGLELAGGLAAPGMQAGTRFINQGVGGVDRAARASLVGAGTGAIVGGANAEGGLAERTPAAVTGALVGFGAGAAGQGALDRFSRPSTRAPSNARILSRAGVNMTPAQLLNGVPVAGRVARVLEQGAASIPFAGAVPAAAEREAVRSFNRAAINRVLGIIDEAIPESISGREAIRAGDDLISARYRVDLEPVVIQPSDQINERIMAALNPRNLSRTTRNTLQDTAADIVERLRGPITGPEWKQIDSELSGLINTTANGDAASRPLSRALRDVRAVVGDALEQAAPGTLARVRETDDAFGNFALIRKAASNPTTGRNDGLFSPDNLNSVLARSEGRAYGRGEARLQELVDPAVNVMAGTLPNSGTAERMATIGLATGAAGAGTLVNAGVAIPTIVGVSALYSQPAQWLMNAIYRASDSQTARGELAALAQLAGRTPALVPYYEAALERVLQLEATAGQGSPQAQQSTPSQMSVQP